MLERYRKYKCCVFIDFEYIIYLPYVWNESVAGIVGAVQVAPYVIDQTLSVNTLKSGTDASHGVSIQ